MKPAKWTAVRAALAMAALAGAAACQTDPPASPAVAPQPSTGATLSAPPSAPMTVGAPPAVPLPSEMVSRAVTISVSKDDACREAGEAYNAMSQALVKVAKPGADPVYSTAELAPMRAQITKTTERLSRLAFRSSDERLRAAIQQLADAGAAYLPVTRLGTAHQEGAALSQAARNLGDLCN